MKPAFILGIDGLPFTLARHLIDLGVMPNLGDLARRGTLARMHSTIPDFSCVAWTSFATGVNPGKHGIFGFEDFHPVTGEHYIPQATDCRVAPLWHEVGKDGGRSIVFNLPGSYPALPLRGKMVAGFIASEFDKACYPPTFAQTLRTLGYRMDLDGQMGMAGGEYVAGNLKAVFEARKTAIRHLIRNENWDLCIAIITETDRLQHFFLHTLFDQSHPLHESARTFYVELDQFVGEVAEMVEGRAALYLVSDHGFEVVRHQVIAHDVLRELGLAPEAERWPWSQPETARASKVFCLEPGRFYVNRKGGRFEHGCVEESEVEGMLDLLSRTLQSLKDPATGEPIVAEVRTKEHGFWGAAGEFAPDLVAAVRPGYYLRAFWHAPDSGVKEISWNANHVWDDAILYAPHAIDASRPPMIWDLLPTVLLEMGLRLPDYVDGRDLRMG